MWYRIKLTITCLLAVIGLAVSTSTAQAGWGHRWGHHHHHYHSSYIGWGWPSYSYSSFYFSVGRPRLFYPSYSVRYYNYYVPTYSVALPTYYYTPTYYVAPTYYAPVVYPNACCDPCSVSSVLNTAPTYSSPAYSQPEYSTGLGTSPAPQVAGMPGGSFVDRMLNRATGRSSSTIPLRAADTTLVAAAAQTSPVNRTTSRDGAVRTVSTLKPVTPDTSSPMNIDQLTPIPSALMNAADEIFAAGGYEQAASAYARLAVRYGNHNELAVRRFIALVANGDHSQASIVYELSVANGQPLTAAMLPSGGLAKLYGARANERKNHIESLAAYALRSDSEAVPLAMVGTWLQLDGQAERAATFMKRAAMISGSSESMSAPALANRLADSPLAR